MNILYYIEKLFDTYFAYLPRPQPKNTKTNPTFITAHRGAHCSHPLIQENTHDAFERALDLGCYGIEFDIHASADNVLVVNHDPTLKRLWGHDIAINALHFKDIRALVPSLPTLTEVIERYGKRMHLFIEVKAPFDATEALADTLKSLIPCEDYHLLSLEAATLPLLIPFPKESLLLVPMHNNVNQFCKLSLKQHFGGVLAHYFLLRDWQINQLRAAHQLIGVGFVDSKLSLYREINRGIPFLFTNNAADIMNAFNALATAR